ncbi:MAG TPA: IS481 family transposase [Thermoleophilaceae bacterium]
MTLHRNAKTCPKSRLLLCRRIEEEGWSLGDAAAAAGLSERRAWSWLKRYREEGEAGLEDRSSAPKHVPSKTPAEREQAILALRELRMTAAEISETIGMAHSTVSLVLKRNGQGRLPRIAEADTRYERARPGELIHIDVKKLGRIGKAGHRVHGDRTIRSRGIGWEYLHVCIDDATRLAFAEVLADEHPATCIAFLRRAVAWFAARGVLVERLMTDNGNPYRSRAHAAACRELGIRHLRTRTYRPQTNGKAERFIRTLLDGWAYRATYRTSSERTAALAGFLTFYNERRPHRALGSRPPSVRLGELMNAVGAYN